MEISDHKVRTDRDGDTPVKTIKLAVLILCAAFFWHSLPALSQSSRAVNPGCALVEQALKAYGEIKPGVMRKDVEKNFTYDGGPDFRNHGRYTYRGCNYIKLEVDFDLASDVGNAPNASDTVRTVSKLFVDYPTTD